MSLRNVFIIREGPEEDKWLDPSVNKTGTRTEAVLRFIESGGHQGKTWKEIQNMIVRFQGGDPEARVLPKLPHDDLADADAEGGGRERDSSFGSLVGDFGRDEDDDKPGMYARGDYSSNDRTGQLINRGRGASMISGTGGHIGIKRFCEKFIGSDGRSRYRVVKEIEPPFFPRRKYNAGGVDPFPPTRDKIPPEAKPPIVRKGGGQP